MKRIIVLGVTGFLFWSCSNNPGESGPGQETGTRTEHHHDESPLTIELNNGERWIVNEEMKPFVLKGSELVNAFIQNKQTDYKALANQLKDQNNELIQSCTMDGKSHDELHKWLHPHLELVEELANASDDNEAAGLILELEKSYQEYQKYFQ